MKSPFCANIKNIVVILFLIAIYIFRCNTCDSLFSTNMSLEHHKDLYDHWSDDDYDSLTDDSDFEDFYPLGTETSAYWCNLRRHNRIETETEFMRNHHDQSILLL